MNGYGVKARLIQAQYNAVAHAVPSALSANEPPMSYTERDGTSLCHSAEVLRFRP
jgi:hypothetical protein